MARVTVEDCLENVDNRFELVLIATRRARQLAHGQTAHVEWDDDKPTVVALREIADGLVTKETLRAQEIAEEEAAQAEQEAAAGEESSSEQAQS